MDGTNFIIHERARQYQWSGDCFLSIKSFYDGHANYHVYQREYHVDEKNYLILNDCTKYTLMIDGKKPVESFCVFFSPAFVSQVVSELNSTDEQLLDFSFPKTEGFNLIERNYQHRGVVSSILLHGKETSLRHKSALEKDEFYHTLLRAIFLQNKESRREADALMFKKVTTRDEIYRRVLFAKDYIDANYSQNLTLKQISKVAMLSENHLLRTFNQIFKISPFQYITRLKIAEAQLQIMETEKSISEIALNLGYASLSNFSYYFKGIVGLSPMGLRKKVAHRK